jgi:hypothetical protein
LDGIFVLPTHTDLNPLEAVLCYKQLWTVEQRFRTAKHLLSPALDAASSTRPSAARVRTSGSERCIRGGLACGPAVPRGKLSGWLDHTNSAPTT